MLTPAQEIYPAVVDSRIVVSGGFGSKAQSRVATDRTMIYSFKEKTWRDGPKFPLPLHHLHLVTQDENVFAVGGYEVKGDTIWNMRAGVWRLDRDMEMWKPGPDLPEPRAEGAAGTIDGTVVMAAGRTLKGEKTGEREDHIEAMDTLLLAPGAMTWTRRKPIPTPRMSGAGAVLNGRLHVLGGRIHTGAGISYRKVDAHEAYDPISDTWTKLAPLPKAVAGMAAAVMDTRLYVFGGEDDKKPYEVYKYVWVYDPAADRWTTLPDMLTPLHGHGAVSFSDGIHLLGGSEKPGGTGTTARHTVFSP